MTFDIGPLNGAGDIAAAQLAVAEAICSGQISPEEAAAAANVLEQVGAAHERRELENRIAALEAVSRVNQSLLKRVAALEAVKRRTEPVLSTGSQQEFESLEEAIEQFRTGTYPPIDYSKLDPNDPLDEALLKWRHLFDPQG
jgi:hypothetical protein